MGGFTLRQLFVECNRLNVFWLSSDKAKSKYLRRVYFSLGLLWLAGRFKKKDKKFGPHVNPDLSIDD